MRETVRICVTLGVETRTLRFEFVKRPDVTVYGTSESRFGGREPEFVGTSHSILCPVTMECDVKVPPSREELRRICDREKTAEGIRAALENVA